MNFGTESIDQDSTFDINITPLIDIVFLLLIFFMISTTFDNPNSIGVKLPSAQRSAQSEESKDLKLSIKEDGILYLGEEEISYSELDTRFSKLPKVDEGRRLVISADKEAIHGAVVRVMDIAKRNGIDKIAIATQPTAE
jgi:biopolymer transport protein ExbD